MKKCPNCGKELDPAAKFCGGCGKALSVSPASQPPVQFSQITSAATDPGFPVGTATSGFNQVSPVQGGDAVSLVVKIALGALLVSGGLEICNLVDFVLRYGLDSEMREYMPFAVFLRGVALGLSYGIPLIAFPILCFLRKPNIACWCPGVAAISAIVSNCLAFNRSYQLQFWSVAYFAEIELLPQIAVGLLGFCTTPWLVHALGGKNQGKH